MERVAYPNATHIQARIRTLDSEPKALTFALGKNLAALSLCASLAPILSPKPQTCDLEVAVCALSLHRPGFVSGLFLSPVV